MGAPGTPSSLFLAILFAEPEKAYYSRVSNSALIGFLNLKFFDFRMEAAMALVSGGPSTRLMIVMALLVATATAQRGTGSSGSTGATSRSTPSTRTPGGAPDTSTKPIFVYGKVMLQGGGALLEPVPIERVCNGTVRREGYADTKGQFEFQLGSNLIFQDASENDSRIAPTSQSRSGSGNSLKPLDLNGCELRAVLAGYQSSIVSLRNMGGDTWQYEVGTIFLKRMGNAPGTTVSVTSMAAPKDPCAPMRRRRRSRRKSRPKRKKSLPKP